MVIGLLQLSLMTPNSFGWQLCTEPLRWMAVQLNHYGLWCGLGALAAPPLPKTNPSALRWICATVSGVLQFRPSGGIPGRGIVCWLWRSFC